MIRGLLILYLSLSVIAPSAAQKIVEHYQYQRDSLRIGKGPKDYLPFGEKGYALQGRIDRLDAAAIAMRMAAADYAGRFQAVTQLR